MKRRLLLLLLAIASVIALIGIESTAYTGGFPDSDEDYSCGGSCHVGPANHGTGIISISADKESVITGQTIVITVEVTETQLGGDEKIGVFLLRSMTGENDRPSLDGWEILQDPNGGTHNYVEQVSPGPGVTVAFNYTLKAPASPGDYNLYARAHHGSTARNALWEDSTVYVVTVTPIPPGVPIIDHTPLSLAYVGHEIPIEAWVTNATTGVFVHWKPADDSNFSSVEMTNTSEVSDGAWKYVATLPAASEETELSYYLVATRGDLYTDTATFTLRIVLEPEKPDVLAWVLQVVIVVEAVALAAYLGFRYTGVRKRPEEE